MTTSTASIDKATERRDITAALEAAFERRHEVLDTIVAADDRASAVAAIVTLLGVPTIGAEAVLGMRFDKLTAAERRNTAAELADLNSRLTFTQQQRPASTDDSVTLRPFDPATDAEVFAARTAEQGVAGDGSGAPAGDLAAELASAQGRVDNEDAAWFVVHTADDRVGLVFGELTGPEVDVRIWIAPERRKAGYGMAALRSARRELAAVFPGVPLVIRAPGAGG